MDCEEVKGESPADEQLEPLLILEEGDEPEEFTNKTARGKGTLRVKNAEEHEDEVAGAKVGEGEHEDIEVNEEIVVKLEDQENKEALLENQAKAEVAEQVAGKEERLLEGTLEAAEEVNVQAGGGLVNVDKAEEGEMEEQHEKTTTTDVVAAEKLQVSPEIQSQAKLRPKDLLRPEDALQKVHRLSHDFPDTLYELLCTLQEGRRLNDQRCSFRLEGRRRCYSEPSTPRHSQKVMFSSMTSLQKEEFFDLVATSQGRRLDDQRADFQSLSPAPSSPEPLKPSSSSNFTAPSAASSAAASAASSAAASAASTAAPSAATMAKFKLRKGSCKGPESSQTVPRPVPKEDLYNMILTSQAQGRLEEQRSVAPGPMDDEDFFSLLLKVQGGRMDEQRTEMPVALKY
ncbi:uncharacterized protein LOC103041297 [Astyanax mexicanus]|uniref:uncharacterized protein LOC103041297 n=1 Tax=Astyanax mexicanus TaxID=7994 RepID=UPI0020CABD80|nr:uncharacterized protein LOC103041297 [Astyanax mexicanus]